MINHMSKKGKLIAATKRSRKFAIHLTSWGYSVRMLGASGIWARLAQALSGGVAVASFGIAVGMWVMPGSNMSADIAIFKYVFSAVLVMTGGVALWFAAQGNTYELQVDSVQRELREVLRNKKEQAIVLRRMPFDHIRSVTLSRDLDRNLPGQARLLLRHKIQGHCIDLVTDKSNHIEALREILALDILLDEVEAVHTFQAPKALQTSHVVPRRVTAPGRETEMIVAAQ